MVWVKNPEGATALFPNRQRAKNYIRNHFNSRKWEIRDEKDNLIWVKHENGVVEPVT